MSFRPQLRGMVAFLLTLAGQIVSTVGSSMTSFGVSIWLYDQTGLASSLTFANAAFLAPVIFLSPFGGTIADRYNRKWLMIATDVLAGMTTIVMLLLLVTGNLHAWHIYILNFLNGTLNTIQWPAFNASITMMVDKKHYARASGLMELGGPASRIFAPAAAAGLYALIGFEGLLWVDVVTFVVAVSVLFFVIIPQPEKSTQDDSKPAPSFLAETAEGFTYLLKNRSLLGMQLMFMGFNFGTIFGVAVLVPMILATTGGDEVALGSARALAAVGGVVGGLVLGAWGGTRKKMPVVLGGIIVVAIFGIFYGMARTVAGWAAAGFMSQFFLPFVNGSAQAIWQSKVPPSIQGRVFAVRRLSAQLMVPIVTLFAGPLADNYFEPAMMEGGALAGVFGWLVGTGPGAGMSIMLVLGSIFSIVVVLIAWTSTPIREAEMLVPDHDVAVQGA